MNIIRTFGANEPLAIRALVVTAVTAIVGWVATTFGVDLNIDPEAVAGIVVAAVTGPCGRGRGLLRSGRRPYRGAATGKP